MALSNPASPSSCHPYHGATSVMRSPTGARVPLMLFTTTLPHRRQPAHPGSLEHPAGRNQRRAAAGLPPRTRKRHRKTLAGLAAGHPRPAGTSPEQRHRSTKAPHPDGGMPRTSPSQRKAAKRTRTAHDTTAASVQGSGAFRIYEGLPGMCGCGAEWRSCERGHAT